MNNSISKFYKLYADIRFLTRIIRSRVCTVIIFTIRELRVYLIPQVHTRFLRTISGGPPTQNSFYNPFSISQSNVTNFEYLHLSFVIIIVLQSYKNLQVHESNIIIMNYSRLKFIARLMKIELMPFSWRICLYRYRFRQQLQFTSRPYCSISFGIRGTLWFMTMNYGDMVTIWFRQV